MRWLVLLLLCSPLLGQSLPDSALYNWNTSVAGTPSAGPNICVTKSSFHTPGGVTCGTIYDSGIPATDLTNALAGLACDQVVILANIQYKGSFNLPQGLAPCAPGHWWVIERDITDTTFPSETQRVDPCYIGIPQTAMPYYAYPTWDVTPNTCARHMPQIISNVTSGNSGFDFNPSSTATFSLNRGRIIGLEFTRDQTFDLSLSLVDLDYQPEVNGGAVGASGDCAWDTNNLPLNAVACMNDQPTFIIFDRCIFHGDAQRQTALGLKIGGTRWIAVKNSYFYDIGVTFGGGGGDGHALGWGTGHAYSNVGEGLFVNNFVSSSTMASEYCGAWDEPVSPATGFDGIPYSVLFFQNFMYKNPLWDVSIGTTLSETETIEGQTYGPEPDQELDITPTAIQLQTSQAYQFNLTWLNDVEGGGLNRAGITLTTSCSSTSASFACVDGIPGGNATVGTITKNGEHTVGSGAWASANQITYTYTAPTSAGTHTITFGELTQDVRLATLSNNRILTASATVTVVSGTPTSTIAVSPSSATLSIQPSYSDANFNTRQFCYTFFEIPNYTPGAITWKVDNISGGNASVGTVTTPSGVVAGEAVYCSGTGTGSHTITATDGTVSGSSTLTVSASAPIIGYDLKPYTSKNAFELKCGSRIAIDQNFFELAWGSQGNGGGQDGTSLIFQVGNQTNQTNDGSGVNVGYGPQHIDNITLDHNGWSHVAFGAVLAALNAALGEHYVSLTNDLWDDMTYERWSNGFQAIGQTLQYSGTASATVLPWTSPTAPLIDHITLNHLTAVAGTGGVTSLISIVNHTTQFPTTNFVITNSILASDGSSTFAENNGDSPDCNTASGTGANNTEARAFQGATSGVACANPYTFNYLALVNSTASPTVFSSSPIWQPSATATDLFANYNGGNGGDYRVCTGVGVPAAGCTAGTYAAGGSRQASDGLALGADIFGVTAAVTNVKSGIAQPYSSLLPGAAPAPSLFAFLKYYKREVFGHAH